MDTHTRFDTMTTDSLRKALRNLSPATLAVEIVEIDSCAPLFPVEEEIIRHAIPDRRIEFAAGRAAARGALASFGLTAVPIGRADDRRPLWPEGFTGSISHTGRYAAAVVGRQDEVASLGLDIEGDAPLERELWRLILREEEILDASVCPRVSGSPLCKVTFVAKEALFKAVYPITRTPFGFRDARVAIGADGSWRASLLGTAPALPKGFTLCRGRWARTAGMVLALICVEYAGQENKEDSRRLNLP